MKLFSKENKETTENIVSENSSKCPMDARKDQYGKAFILALLCNALFLFIIVLSSGLLFTSAPHTQEKIVQIDMSRYEISKERQGNDASKPKSDPGGSSGSKNKASDNKKGGATTPYLGGTENAKFGVSGAVDKGNVGSSYRDGEGSGSDGTGDGDGDGSGNGSGDGIGDGNNGGNGYVDLDEYMARLNARKVTPPQALKRNLHGSVGFQVTFDANGDIVGISLVSSSGHSILDNAATRLIESGGRIHNTTGLSTTEHIIIRYE